MSRPTDNTESAIQWSIRNGGYVRPNVHDDLLRISDEMQKAGEMYGAQQAMVRAARRIHTLEAAIHKLEISAKQIATDMVVSRDDWCEAINSTREY